ncbi:lipid II flippase family protein [Flavobacterium sp. JAS]|uniref:lipid II flippase family protein n=1 Tax=Flavobacterium sp. JAS TaxID=2897329 RepID=UPI001E3F6759|nr:DUF2837 family protein [Flavobacterium sp. JAS]MCD0468399.1 lipid II flippase Amj family protein [Flavobacterium sp. JAS]
MIFSILLVCSLTSIIHFVAIVSLSAKIVGTRTGRIASSASIFNVVIVISQFSNTIQAPLLTKTIENSINQGNLPNNLMFRGIILSATIGCILGGLFIPTIHRFMERGVNALYNNRSIFVILIKSFRLETVIHFKRSFALPKKDNFFRLNRYKDIYIELVLLNVLVYAFITVSVLSCLYAGYLNPNLRTTSLSMSGVAVSLGAIGMMLFIEPYHATLTDKVIDGTVTESFFRRHLTFVVIARIFGTILGQFVFIPLAWMIVKLAEML